MQGFRAVHALLGHGVASAFLAIALLAAPAESLGAASSRYVHVKLTGDVDLGMAPLVERALATAVKEGATGVILEIDTFGGRLDAAVIIRDAILDAEVPTTCYVNKRAISAGALICLATTTIDMAPGSTLGAATPVIDAGDGKMTAADAKAISYVRKEFRATAEARKRPLDLAEAMVDGSVATAGREAGKPLTLTTEEALAQGVATRSSVSLDQAVASAGFASHERVAVSMNWAEEAARLISHPVLSGLLLTIGLLGILIEIKTPGWGPGIVGLCALGLFFFGHKVVRLADWMDVALVGIGLLLLVVEIFVFPGFGVAGLIGILFLVGGLLLAMVGRDWHVALAAGTLRSAALTLSVAVLLAATGFVMSVRYLPHSSFFARRGLVLNAAIASPEASFIGGLTRHVGRVGVARTTLRPAGTVVVDDERLDAVSEGDVIPSGSAIEVTSVRGASVVVRLARTDSNDNLATGDNRDA